MKSVLTLIALVALTLTISAQPKPPPKPAAPPAAAKPKPGPPPYAMKKDVEEAMAGMTAKINSVAANTNGLRGLISAKDASIDRLSEQMSKVEEILNLTKSAVTTTSDSLDQTRFSIEEFRKNTDSNVRKLEESIAQTMMIIWILLGITILLPILVFVVMNKKVSSLRSAMNSQNFSIESKMAESLETNSDLIKKEGRSQRLYTDTELSIVKNNFTKSLKGEMESFAKEMDALRDEMRGPGDGHLPD